jgi:hypothetical protein
MRTFRELMEASSFSHEDWLTNEISMFNVKINRKTFTRENGEMVDNAHESILGFSKSISHDDSLSFPAYAGYVLFPRLVLRSPPTGCKGKHAATSFARRCTMINNMQIAELLHEAHDSHVMRAACRVHALTNPANTFPLAARAASLASCGATRKACKLAFSYGTEPDPVVAATFLAKLTMTIPHAHVSPPPTAHKSVFVPIPLKVITDAFTGMSKKSAPHRDGWTCELFKDAAS